MKQAGLAALLAAAVLVVAGVALAGTTPAQYRRQATAVCKTTTAKLKTVKAAIAQLDRGADPQQIYNAMSKTLSPISDAEDAAWTKLHVPACANGGS